MKKIYFLLLLYIPISIIAQENMSYKTDYENIEFKISTTEFYVKYNSTNKNILLSKLKTENITEVSENFAIVKIIDLLNKSNFSNQKIEILDKYKSIFQKIEPVLVYKDGVKEVCNGEIIIKLTNNANLKDLLNDYEYSIIENEFVKNQFLVKLNDINTQELFKLVDRLKPNSNVEFVEPNFTRFLVPHTNDPLYNYQWSINNQGYLGGTIDADMDVDGAWPFSTGAGIKVAVLDEGVDLSHPDLTANLLTGYDATGNNSNGAPNENTDDSHGTNCAGIIASVANNTVGTAGVAYDSKIIPIRIAYTNGYPLGDRRRNWITNDNWIANGINWAVLNNADILSNSWGGGNPSNTITNAIANAVNNGRNYKGCIVLFSSGNDNTNVSYPATLANVIAVGATSMCDERKRSTSNASLLSGTNVVPDPNNTSCDGEYWWGSNYGTNLDVVAPGVNIYTTDISGSAGYDTGDNFSNFNGTSSACPNVAGVVALILSVKPTLTGIQARQILESSTDKISGYVYSSSVSGQPNGTWNNEVGYGRINASKAVINAINPSIIGNSNICISANDTYTIDNYNNAFNTVWTTTSNLQIINQTPYNVVVKGLMEGIGTLTATFQNGMTVTKNIWVGVAQFNVVRDATQNESCDTKFHYVPFYINTPPNSTIKFLFLSPQVTYTVGSNNLYTFNFPKGYSGPFEYIISSTNVCGTYIYDSVDMGDSNMISNCNSMGLLANTNLYKIYPNPTNNVINVSLADENEKPITTSKIIAELYDLMGQSKQKVEVKNNTASISVVGLPKGVYISNIIIDGKTEGHQVIIE
jgi:subtilisin family serine protease